jgi:hypothetical protein
MQRLALSLVLACAAAAALAQPGSRADGRERQPPQMSHEERQRLREDMREVYRDRDAQKGERPDRGRPLSTEEREKLRRDVQDANRDLRPNRDSRRR